VFKADGADETANRALRKGGSDIVAAPAVSIIERGAAFRSNTI
jgi:hypothetical protein